jgi:RTX calcium-binding nonapeptide repeat (4 copies)
MPRRLRPYRGCVLGCLIASCATFGFVSGAEARTSCSFSGAKNVLTVRSTGDALSQITRDGPKIVVREFLSRPARCRGGQATVRNTDTIVVVMRGFLAFADILLKNGPLAPGATPEANGASEIEIRFRGSDAFGDIYGTRKSDEFHWGEENGLAGLNLNPSTKGDNDIDVTAKGLFAFLVAEGAEGNDRIIPQPGTRMEGGVFSIGGAGNDVLIAPPSGGIQDGGPGNDTVLGKTGRDLIRGGPGRDRLSGAKNRDFVAGGPGRDRISSGPGRDRVRSRDRKRETVRCGPGRDQVRADRLDRLRSCERVDRSERRLRPAADSAVRRFDQHKRLREGTLGRAFASGLGWPGHR